MILIQAGFGLSIKQGHMFGDKESNRKMVAIKLPFICIYWLNKPATVYWYECARAAFNDPGWFIENHHAVRQAKRRAMRKPPTTEVLHLAFVEFLRCGIGRR